MKKIVFLIVIMISGLQAWSQEAKSSKAAVISFEEQLFDFGDITQGDVVRHTFKFKNSGNDTLRLSNVTTTCGCTSPSWTKTPVAPGASGEIVASFNSTGKMGLQNKVVTVMSNASNSQATFTIKANILPAAGDNMRAGQK
ncbi:MAG: DUF1573 domain-containing protein [Cytophagales bacterium]